MSQNWNFFSDAGVPPPPLPPAKNKDKAKAAERAATIICNNFATTYMDVHTRAGPWGTLHVDDVAKIIEKEMA